MTDKEFLINKARKDGGLHKGEKPLFSDRKQVMAKKMPKKNSYLSPDKGDRRPGMEGSGKFGRKKVGGGYEEYLEQ